MLVICYLALYPIFGILFAYSDVNLITIIMDIKQFGLTLKRLCKARGEAKPWLDYAEPQPIFNEVNRDRGRRD